MFYSVRFCDCVAPVMKETQLHHHSFSRSSWQNIEADWFGYPIWLKNKASVCFKCQRECTTLWTQIIRNFSQRSKMFLHIGYYKLGDIPLCTMMSDNFLVYIWCVRVCVYVYHLTNASLHIFRWGRSAACEGVGSDDFQAEGKQGQEEPDPPHGKHSLCTQYGQRKRYH